MSKDLTINAIIPIRRDKEIKGSDSLADINDVITDGLKKWETFDVNIHPDRMDAVKRVIKARDLEMFDPELEVDDCITMVVGLKGADFEKHENLR